MTKSCHALTTTLVALFAAKTGGRNRTVVAESSSAGQAFDGERIAASTVDATKR